jgi:diacylglycerol kinase family enzyme
VRVESDSPVPVQLDGDEWGTTPLELTLLPSVLNVLAPPDMSPAEDAMDGQQDKSTMGE